MYRPLSRGAAASLKGQRRACLKRCYNLRLDALVNRIELVGVGALAGDCAMNRDRPPKIDESIERDEVTYDDFRDAMRMILRDAKPPPKDQKQVPTQAELRQRWKLRRR